MEAHLDYPTVCKYHGQAVLESRHQIEVIKDSANQQIQDLSGKLDAQSKYVKDLELQLSQLQSQLSKVRTKASEAGISAG